ncbi:MAG TPA: hypothetical protein VG817_11110 [Gemmatimonadales bacterium]|nr:hypothetical protein [Gemmatimonadales bacterium]
MRRAALLALLPLFAGCRAEQPAVAVRVELAGGANPGVYTAVAPEAGCNQGLLGPGSWAVQLTDWAGPKSGLRSLQLVVPSQARPRELYLGLVFGDFFTGVVHEIETRPEAPRVKGWGELGIDSTQDGATLIVTGSTGDTVALTATIACARTQEKPGRTP